MQFPSTEGSYPLRPLCFAVVCLMLLVACTPIEPSTSARWEVQPSLYSGRENPQRLLTVEEDEQFEGMVAGLPAGAVIERGGLGYQGFIVRRVGQGEANGIMGVFVYDGIVEVTHHDGIYYLADPERALERWLFESIKGILSESEREGIEAALQG